ncbi:hypothetical protein IQ260_16335 [Leptolyngbya cf. ectocarpi LEGE 11479]|uniref:Uncharacterized protein n=1 Tax=Leptolyngbya cf. ectocarpi LEGE 11479 TaxID=1828722 RepID=A0A928ZVP3_LEPEC|nr:hypothetical protein [Leptolyngbya cf. ectocarpi LEGE 11479]
MAPWLAKIDRKGLVDQNPTASHSAMIFRKSGWLVHNTSSDRDCLLIREVSHQRSVGSTR